MTPPTAPPFRHLLIFINSLADGGAERVTANMANHWAGKGLRVTVLTQAARSRDAYALHESVGRIALDCTPVSANALAAVRNNVRQIRALRRVLVNLRPDVALAMMDKASVQLALAGTGLDVVCIGSEHTHPPAARLGFAWERLRRLFYGRLAAVCALTEPGAAWLRAHTSARRVAVIANAAPWPLPVSQPVVAPPARPGAQKTLLAAGRLCHQKGFDILIEAFARLAADFPAWQLAIAGDGPLRATLQEQIERAGLARRITLAGRVGNLGAWYEAADAFVLSSRVEGFGNVLVEAMSYGLPVASFDCDSGPRDIVRHDVNGLLAAPGDVRALEQALRTLLADAALRRRLGAEARQARERYSLEAVGEQWERLFRSVRAASGASLRA